MDGMTSQDTLNLLIADQMSLTAFVSNAIDAAAPFAAGCAHQSLLANVRVAGPFEDFDQDVEIKVGDSRQFLRMQDAWEAGRVRFSVRTLSPTASMRSLEDRVNVPRGIFGFVGTYGAICVRRHERLDCVTVQFC